MPDAARREVAVVVSLQDTSPTKIAMPRPGWCYALTHSTEPPSRLEGRWKYHPSSAGVQEKYCHEIADDIEEEECRNAAVDVVEVDRGAEVSRENDKNFEPIADWYHKK